MHHARIKAKVRSHQLPGQSSNEVDGVLVRRATTNSDNSLSSSDSGGGWCRTKTRDCKQVPVTIATDTKQQQQQLFLGVDTTDEVRCGSLLRPLQIATITSPPLCTAAEPMSADNTEAMPGSLLVPSAHSSGGSVVSSVRRRSVSLGRTSSLATSET